MKYIIDKRLDLKNDAGFKARVDIINILEEIGYEYNSILDVNSKWDIYGLIKAIKKLNFNDGDMIVIQYPLNINLVKGIIAKAKKNKCKLICIIHDIESLRAGKSYMKIKREINLFNRFDCIISHNESMERWLKSNGVNKEILNLNLFDYLCDKKNENSSNNIDKYNIAYATGKLGTTKSKFLFSIDKFIENEYQLILYGEIDKQLRETIAENEKVIYKGPLAPDVITQKIQGEFGLIWDSESIDECTGVFGNYTRYNNPHKLSMYIASGLPVISWNKSAISKFIKENNIGFCVESLEEINSILKGLKKQDYLEMKKRVDLMTEDVINGTFTKNIFGNL